MMWVAVLAHASRVLCWERSCRAETFATAPARRHACVRSGRRIRSAAVQAEVKQLHSDARASGRWDNSAYIMSNAQEFFAEATQAWFEATVRTDVTSGLRTKHELHRRDPALAAFMLRVYGGNDWVFPDTAPGRFSRAPPKCARVATGEIRRRLQGPGDASTGEAAAGDAGGAVGGAPHAPAGPRARKFAAMKRNLQDVMEDAKGGFRALFAPSLS